MPIATCPSPVDLQRLLTAGQPQRDIDALEAHVLDCGPCMARVKTLLGAQQTLTDLRSDATAGDVVGPVVEDLMNRLESLRPAAGFANRGNAMIAFACSTCQKKLSVKPDLAGKKVKCPVCGQVTAVPAPVAATNIGDLRTLPLNTVSTSQPHSPPANSQAADMPTQPPAHKLDSTKSTDWEDAGHDSSLTDFLAPRQADDELGRLGKYRILKVLGHGGMGVVFKAEDPKLKRTVAIKAMLPTLAASASAGKRFLREAEAMAAVEHDHIVRIYQIDEERGVPFLAMEFLKGEPLDERLKRGDALPIRDVLRIGREIAEALAAAHATGLIHRDIKPANIWLEARGTGSLACPAAPDERTGKAACPTAGRVKILDFGLARAATQESGLTQQGAIIGTPAYMAPEQARGETVDARCDLFSLGVVLYRLCCGKQPFGGKDTVSTLLEIALHEPTPPVMIKFNVPQALSDLVMKLLAKDPAARIASANEVVQALQIMERELTRQQEAKDATQAVSYAPAGDAGSVAYVGDAASVAKPAPAVAARTKSQPRPHRPRLVAALYLLAGLVVVAAGAFGIIRIATPEGDYVIDTDDPDFSFKVSKGTVILEDVKTKRKYNLKVVQEKTKGEYELEVTDADNDLAFNTKTFTIKRGQQVALKAWFERRPSGVVKGGLVNPLAPLAPSLGSIVQKFRGHTAPVVSVALSGDGKRVVTGSDDGTAILWEVGSGKKLQTFEGHTDLVWGVALSDDGMRIVTGSKDNTAILWDGATGKKLQTFQGHTAGVRSVALSRDGKHAVTGSFDKTAILWEAATGRKLQSFRGHFRFVTAVALSGDAKHILTGSDDTTAILWEAASGNKVQSFRGHTDLVWGVALSVDAKLVLTASRDKTAILWQAASGDKLQSFLGHTGSVWGVAVSGDGKHVLTGSEDATAILWEAASGKKLQSFLGHTDWILSVALSGGGKHVLTGSSDKTAILWEVKALPPPLHASWFKAVAAMPAAKQVGTVADKLKERNPGFDGTVFPAVDSKAGVVTGFEVKSGKVIDISPVQALTGLRSFKCVGTKVSDLSPLKGMKLTRLLCGASGVSDLAALKDMPLAHLDFWGTQVSDLSPLAGMPLTNLSLNGTKVTDLSPLKGMKLTILVMHQTRVTDLSVLKGMPLTLIRFDVNTVVNAEILRGIPTLETINGKSARDFWKEDR